MTQVDETRASGSTPAEEAAHDANRAIDEEFEPHELVADERPSPRFMRMRFNWRNAEEMQTVRMAGMGVDALIVREFADAYQILDEIQSIVRTPVLTPGGDQALENGHPVWERTPNGKIIEDYSRLTRKQQENALGQITTRLFAWEQTAERIWMDAMMARAVYEERFAISYDELRGTMTRTTVDDRTQHANLTAAEDRYFAIYMTSASRRAQAVVRSLERLGQRLKDVIVAG
jgi:hypothetical protein